MTNTSAGRVKALLSGLAFVLSALLLFLVGLVVGLRVRGPETVVATANLPQQVVSQYSAAVGGLAGSVPAVPGLGGGGSLESVVVSPVTTTAGATLQATGEQAARNLVEKGTAGVVTGAAPGRSAPEPKETSPPEPKETSSPGRKAPSSLASETPGKEGGPEGSSQKPSRDDRVEPGTEPRESREAGEAGGAGGAAASGTGEAEPLFSVQVEAFLVKKRAEELVRTLKLRGYKPYILETTDRMRQTWYAVRMGDSPAEEPARRIAVSFQAKEGIPATVLPWSAAPEKPEEPEKRERAEKKD